ncbi:LacI family DNA-binding transcriptional regulator [Levilactobacillus angrenensis]|uniref:LacI family DNA-binding transcriptional regulator n=1 Tax=Levilactobacillus angrenensis TaxID=2486020 RepID=A0ABW1U555_9LACO
MKTLTGKVTIKDVAKAAGVSEATVSRALSHSPRVKRDTSQKIQNIASNLGYHPNDLARSIRVQQTHTLGLIIPDILNAFFTHLSRAIEDAASRAGYDVILVNTDENLAKEASGLNLLLEKQVDGVIITSAGGPTDYAAILGPTPAVFVDRMPPTPNHAPYDRVLVDNVQGTRAIVTQLINQGAQRVGIINSAVSFTASERLTGYQEALTAAGIEPDAAIEATARTDNSNVQQMTRQLVVNQKCDGLFVADNTIMQSVLRKLPDLDVPNLQLGGFDDQDWFDFLPQRIVTARQPIAELGQTAIDRLVAKIDDPDLLPEEIRLAATTISR